MVEYLVTTVRLLWTLVRAAHEDEDGYTVETVVVIAALALAAIAATAGIRAYIDRKVAELP